MWISYVQYIPSQAALSNGDSDRWEGRYWIKDPGQLISISVLCILHVVPYGVLSGLNSA
jgi:hypothetical protein